MNAFWQLVGVTAATAIVAAFLVTAVLRGFNAFFSRKGHRLALVLFAAFLSSYAATKMKVAEKPSWMEVNAIVNTNTWNEATVAWAATGFVPADAPVLIDVALDGQAVTNWTQRASTTYAAASNVVSFAGLSPSNPTNYILRLRCDYLPCKVEITDFLARASLTNRIVDVTFSAPTNLVGKTGTVEYRMLRPGEPWRFLTTVVARTNNHVRAVGNFVSRGIDRAFRVRFYDGNIYPLEDAQQ